MGLSHFIEFKKATGKNSVRAFLSIFLIYNCFSHNFSKHDVFHVVDETIKNVSDYIITKDGGCNLDICNSVLKKLLLSPNGVDHKRSNGQLKIGLLERIFTF